MDEQIARVIAAISTLDDLSTFEANARERNVLTEEVKQAIKRRSGQVGRDLIREKTGLDLTSLSPAEEKIVEAACEFLRVRKEQGKSATRTLDQLRNRGLIGAAEAAVSRAKPTQGFQALADANLADLSYEQIIVDHPDEFSPRALWFSRRTLTAGTDQLLRLEQSTANCLEPRCMVAGRMDKRRVVAGRVVARAATAK